MYEWSEKETTALQSDFPFLGQTCMWAKMGKVCLQTHIVVSFQYASLCVLTCTTWKLRAVYGCSSYQTTAILSEISILWVVGVYEIRWVRYGPKPALQTFFNMTFLLTFITWKVQVVYGRPTYWMTAFGDVFFYVRAGLRYDWWVPNMRHSLFQKAICAYIHTYLENYWSYMDVLHIKQLL